MVPVDIDGVFLVEEHFTSDPPMFEKLPTF